MHHRKATKLVADLANELRADCSACGLNGGDATSPISVPQVIRAELVRNDTCAALGITARAYAPVLALCRLLVVAGHDPDRPLHVHRGEALALVVQSIGQAAALTIDDDRLGRPRARVSRSQSDVTGAPVERTPKVTR